MMWQIYIERNLKHSNEYRDVGPGSYIEKSEEEIEFFNPSLNKIKAIFVMISNFDISFLN